MTASEGPGVTPDGALPRQPAAPPKAGFGSRVGTDLGTRVGSGLVLATIVAVAIWAGALPFAALLAVTGGVVAWEWSRIVRGPAVDLAMVVAIAAPVAAVVMTQVGTVGEGSGVVPALAIAIVGGAAVLLAAMCRTRHSLLSAIGGLVAGWPVVAFFWLRRDPQSGAAAVAFLFAVVATTDTAAYFSGRLLGGPKLWPRVSPNKTWAGLGGGVSAAALVGAIVGAIVPAGHPAHLMLLGAALACVAQAGDLAESALKRRFGTKDASGLIPGHGGVMDRVDGLFPAAMAAALWAAHLDGTAPARALLTW